MARQAGVLVGVLFLANVAAAQFAQQGSKLLGTGATGPTPWQGNSVAISADGNTAIVGGPGDSNNTGAAWVFTRSGQAWSQQGGKLLGSGADGVAEQGWSVAISADGNTAIVGGPTDSYDVNHGSHRGAVWVFSRTDGAWSQQGSKLIGSDAVGVASQGVSVAISADGNTAIVGGPGDNSSVGAAWVFTRSGGVWSQQGNKLVGWDAAGSSEQGCSVALDADGNTAIVGGYQDHSGNGAAWVFTRRAGLWAQEGYGLAGTGAGGPAQQGASVAMAADGNTAVIGGPTDNFNVGAAWVFTRSGGIWTQQGNKLLGTGAAGTAHLGWSVALAGDGDTAIVGGPADSSLAGASWVFTRSGQVWSQQGSKLLGTGATGAARQGTSVAISADGSTAVVGGPADYWTGAVWVFFSRVCTPVSIARQPQDWTIPEGQTATLTVVAAGSTPLTYQWFEGASGDTSRAVGTDASSFTTPALTATTSYWVRVSNACGEADSATATVTGGSRLRRLLPRAGGASSTGPAVEPPVAGQSSTQRAVAPAAQDHSAG